MTEIIEANLENGLKVLLKPVRTAPVATFWVWYRVGSRNEVPGITGISHWVEHMMFKGTPTLNKGEIMHLINRNGGVDNAFTSTDFTAYFETLPSDRVDLALRIESDRMVNALFDPEEVASERTVIISEREGAENEPRFWLGEDVQAAAFKVHPYHHDTIGWKQDLQVMTRDQLYHHYLTYYVPNNAIIVAAGDFDADEMLKKIKEKFGAIPRGAAPPAMQTVEPLQEAERRILMRRPGPTHYFHAAYHAPKATDPDFFPMFVLAGVLDGVGGMSFSGHGSPGRSARLYRALVETELATGVDFGFRETLDPGLIDVTATARPGVPLEKIERAIFAELDKIANKPITDAEFANVIKQAKVQFVYATDGVMNVGYILGQMEIVASYKNYATFLDNLQRVTKADVQRVAQKYFVETNRTVGWFIPTNGAPRKNANGAKGTKGTKNAKGAKDAKRAKKVVRR
ncbi:MAG: insulinase family protein [Chloroflexi bacterium]|nr:insulinase family protein [Chloroflexota bacterium]